MNFRKLKKDNETNGVSILWVVGTVISLSIALVVVSFMIFLNSSAYDTVKQITAASKTLQKDDLEGYDTTSPIRASDLGDYSRSLKAKVDNLNDEQDFSNEKISKEALGY
jgi:cell division protein FtsL